jgi:hypothetical protein
MRKKAKKRGLNLDKSGFKGAAVAKRGPSRHPDHARSPVELKKGSDLTAFGGN